MATPLQLPTKPNIDKYLQGPHTLIGASGLDVGLPDGQMGNSEVGHTNIGAGRIVYQMLVKITKDIQDGVFFENKALCDAMENCKKNGTALHLMGLLSPGGVHSHMEHLFGLLEMAKRHGLKDVYVHAFLDGRDEPPTSAAGFMKTTCEKMQEIGVGKIATISGRYYAMDRDNAWDRVEKAYAAMVYGEGETGTRTSSGNRRFLCKGSNRRIYAADRSGSEWLDQRTGQRDFLQLPS